MGRRRPAWYVVDDERPSALKGRCGVCQNKEQTATLDGESYHRRGCRAKKLEDQGEVWPSDVVGFTSSWATTHSVATVSFSSIAIPIYPDWDGDAARQCIDISDALDVLAGASIDLDDVAILDEIRHLNVGAGFDSHLLHHLAGGVAAQHDGRIHHLECDEVRNLD